MRRKKKQQARRRQATLAALLALLGAAGAGLVPVLRRRRGAGGASAPTPAAPASETQGETAAPASETQGPTATPAAEATVESPGGAGGTPVPAGVTPAPATVDHAVENEWHCESCGQAFRISGEGRHRIYWLPEAAPSDPVVDGRCPSCGTPLPGHRVHQD